MPRLTRLSTLCGMVKSVSLLKFTCTRLTALFSGTTRVSRYQKGKPIWILLKQETVSSSGISWAICKSAPRSRQITMPAPHHSVSKHWRHWMGPDKWYSFKAGYSLKRYLLSEVWLYSTNSTYWAWLHTAHFVSLVELFKQFIHLTFHLIQQSTYVNISPAHQNRKTITITWT